MNGFENIHDRMPAIIPLENAGSWLQDVADAIGGAVTDLAAEER
ncbi:MAG: SOS response-associated peptidase [Eubacterium sp.]|nr:SOS response-associated peptidase [Eubacterium sp.]